MNSERSTDVDPPPRPSVEVISAPEACELLSVHRNTLYRLIQSGQLPAFRLIPGGRWRFCRQELEQWIEDRQGRRA